MSENLSCKSFNPWPEQDHQITHVKLVDELVYGSLVASQMLRHGSHCVLSRVYGFVMYKKGVVG